MDPPCAFFFDRHPLNEQHDQKIETDTKNQEGEVKSA
jgi:hypothetical protein